MACIIRCKNGKNFAKRWTFQNGWQINVLINSLSNRAKHNYTIIDDFPLPKD